jgi:hypothetical protein
VNQISWPSGDQSRPCRLAHPVESVVFFPFRSTTANFATIIANRVPMVKKSNVLSVARNARVADPVGPFDKHFAGRIFQSPLLPGRIETDHCHLLAVGGPIHALDVIHDRARSLVEPAGVGPAA